MTHRYTVNYDWSHLGPTQWTERSIVTLQVDLHSYEERDGEAVWQAISAWWEALPKDEEAGFVPAGTQLGYAGGCRMLAPVRVSAQHTTLWLLSHGEDAFDSIAHYADEVREVAEQADSEVEITWTELPHRDGPADD